MAAITIEFNKIKQGCQNNKAFRDTITNPDLGLSEAVKNAGIAGGDDGQDLAYLTGFVDEKYERVYEYDPKNASKKIKKVASVLFLQLLHMGGWARQGTRCSSPKGCGIFATVCLLYPTKNQLWISQNKY